MGLEARIWAFWIGFGPREWDLGLGTGIWASRRGAGGRTEEEEKIRHMFESIGHRPLRSHCPAPPNFNHNLLKQGMGTVDHLTLLRLFNIMGMISGRPLLDLADSCVARDGFV